jgi:FdhD protein
MEGLESREIAKLTYEGIARGTDCVACERPLSIIIENQVHGRHELGITMRTGGHDRLLVLGFIYSEGIISSIDDVSKLEIDNDHATIELYKNANFDPKKHCRNSTVTSSCGICGRASFEGGMLEGANELDERMKISLDAIANCIEAVTRKQLIFSQTGGSHACASFTSNGSIERVFEDVGRHNAFDKLVGSYIDEGRIPNVGLGAFVSGRASYELVQKSIRAGFPIMIAIGAPSSLAVDLAKEHGMTLGCFAKDDSITLFSGVRRILQ